MKQRKNSGVGQATVMNFMFEENEIEISNTCQVGRWKRNIEIKE